MTLKELMQLCYNAGGYIYEDAPKGGGGFEWWWGKYGEDRHDAFTAELISPEAAERLVEAIDELGDDSGDVPKQSHPGDPDEGTLL